MEIVSIGAGNLHIFFAFSLNYLSLEHLLPPLSLFKVKVTETVTRKFLSKKYSRNSCKIKT